MPLSKTNARFWLPRLFKWEDSPNYSIRVQFRGRRMTFSLGTGNRDAAARSAANIYRDLLALGVEATTAKYRAQGQREISSKGCDYWRVDRGGARRVNEQRGDLRTVCRKPAVDRGADSLCKKNQEAFRTWERRRPGVPRGH